MKKICFISYTNLYLVPYLKNYTDIMEEDGDAIVWNRHNLKEENDRCNVISYDFPVDDNSAGKMQKLRGYIAYTRFVKKQLKKKDYDVVICLQSISAIFSAPFFLTKYRRKYVIDVRDYSIEGNWFLRGVEGILMNFSIMNVISSEGYKAFLPKKKKYQLVHNYSTIEPEIVASFSIRSMGKQPIRLSYIGLIRFQEQNKRIIDLFANDDRFAISFIGKNALELKEYMEEHRIKNVRLIDQFPPEKTLDYYKETDAILNVYGNNTPLLDYALSNKLYFAAALKMPILVSKDTFMEKKSIEGGFGFVLDFEDERIKDKLVTYMNDLSTNRENFNKRCEMFMDKVINENTKFFLAVQKILYDG